MIFCGIEKLNQINMYSDVGYELSTQSELQVMWHFNFQLSTPIFFIKQSKPNGKRRAMYGTLVWETNAPFCICVLYAKLFFHVECCIAGRVWNNFSIYEMVSPFIVRSETILKTLIINLCTFYVIGKNAIRLRRSILHKNVILH